MEDDAIGMQSLRAGVGRREGWSFAEGALSRVDREEETDAGEGSYVELGGRAGEAWPDWSGEGKGERVSLGFEEESEGVPRPWRAKEGVSCGYVEGAAGRVIAEGSTDMVSFALALRCTQLTGKAIRCT